MTQRDVAAKIGKPPSFIGKVEKVERNLSVIEFVAWANAIGLDAHDLLKSIDPPLPREFEI